jgi:hypothetical protein
MKKKELEKIVMPDCKSVNLNPRPANLLAFQNKPDTSENSQELNDVENSVIVGTDANNSEINATSQTNHVQENRGVTGIQGTGYTINNYACPKEIIDFVLELMRKGSAI